jgi:hypothetical protein
MQDLLVDLCIFQRLMYFLKLVPQIKALEYLYIYIFYIFFKE